MIYFDNAASSWPKPERVTRETARWIESNGANPGRSNHSPAMEAGRVIRETRQACASFLGRPNPERVVFTFNATHALNLAIRGTLKPNDHVITTTLEHNSVLRPLHQLRDELNLSIDCLEPDETGRLRPHALETLLRPDTALVTLTHASNLLGTVQPISDLIERVRGGSGGRTRVLVDAAQTAGKRPLPVADWDVDMVAFAGHKGVYGIQGTGVLYVREGIELRPLMAGGTGTQSHRPIHPESMPERLEAGTANTPGIVSLKHGLDFVRETGIDTIHRKERELTDRLLEGLRSLSGVTVYNASLENASEETSVVTFNLDGVDPVEVAYYYDRQYDMAVRAGIHCAPWAHRWLGTLDRDPQGAVRASPGYFNGIDEVESFLEATEAIRTYLVDSSPTSAGST